jgi:hypothetical protein
MKMIKTYEGFFDFLNKKEKKDVYLDDIRSCLDDIVDEARIDSEVRYESFVDIRGKGIFVDGELVFKKGFFSAEDKYVTGDGYLVRGSAEDYREKNLLVRGNALSFNMTYDPREISDDEVNNLLLECKSKLEIYDCEISFFIGWGRDEGGKSDKEWSDFKKMLDKTIGDRTWNRNITIKIQSPNGFIK